MPRAVHLDAAHHRHALGIEHLPLGEVRLVLLGDLLHHLVELRGVVAVHDVRHLVKHHLHAVLERVQLVRARLPQPKRDAVRRDAIARWHAEPSDPDVLAARRAAADLVELVDPPAPGTQQRVSMPLDLLEQLGGLVGVGKLLDVVHLVDAVIGGAGRAGARHLSSTSRKHGRRLLVACLAACLVACRLVQAASPARRARAVRGSAGGQQADNQRHDADD